MPARRVRLQLEILEDRALPSSFTVTNLLDTGAGSLRAAVSAANTNPGADVINFATTGTINLTSGELSITDSLTINGPGVNSLTVSGNNLSRVFSLASNPTVVLTGLTVANGWASGVGGGIYEAGGNLTLDHCAVSGNIASGTYGGDGQGAGGGVYVASGTLTIDHSTLSNNIAIGAFSSYGNGGSGAGGGLYVAGGMVHVNETTISKNQAGGSQGSRVDMGDGLNGGNGAGGGFYIGGGTVFIDNSTFSGNLASGGSGGDGAPEYYTGDYPYFPYYLDVPAGHGGQGGGGLGGGITVAAGSVQVNHSTLSGNCANGGAGGLGFPNGPNGLGVAGGISNNGSLQMYDTILAGNTADGAPDLGGALASLGHNLIGDTTGGSGFAASDLLNVNPQLGPLQNNGGPTQTMALLAGSPAIDAGDNSAAPAFDQRGAGFARIVGGSIDIGAFEVQTPSAPQASSFTVSGFPSSPTAGTAGSFTVMAKNTEGTTATNYTGTVHFSSSDSQALLPSNYTFTAADAGVHSFSAILKTAGTQSLTVTDATSASLTGSETGITVNPAAASTMSIAGFPSPSTAGVAGNFSVTLRDAYGNVATSYTETVHITSSDGRATLPANYTFTAADAGVHTFSGTLKTAGMQSITVADTVNASIAGTQGGITVNSAAASKYLISAPASVRSGTAFSLMLTIQDAYGNIVTGYTGTVHFSSSDTRSSLPANYTLTAADRGVHTFTGLVLRSRGSQKITITDTHNSSLTGSVTENVI